MREPTDPSGDNPLLVCMLPVRNAEDDLPGYLENVSKFCDAIVALDDGSTDGTYDILASHPLVKVLLRNPPRQGFGDWNDAVNRNRLLQATEELNPQWLIALDADERIDTRDASSLRAFLQTDALPGFAYGFRHVPMTEDGERFLPRYLWYYRLFAAMPGQRLPSHKLHFVPVPTNISRERWIKTTWRIQHLGELAPERRLARFAKYLEADPERAYDMDYSKILARIPESSLRHWRPRPESMPVMLSSAGDLSSEESDSGSDDVPAMSVIILAVGDSFGIERTVASVMSQDVPASFEVIVVTERGSTASRIVRDAFPDVVTLETRSGALPGETRNAGLDAARGKVIVFVGADTELLPGNLAARLDGHRRGFAMVTGAVYNQTRSPGGWAWYFLEHFDSLPGLPALEQERPPTHCSYGRLPLVEIGDFQDGHGVDVEEEANRALVRRTYFSLRASDAEQIQPMPYETVPEVMWQQFERGRRWGRELIDRHRQSGRMLSVQFARERFLEAIPLRLLEIEANALLAENTYRETYQQCRALVVAGAVARLLGMWFEVLRPATGKLELLIGHPVVTALIMQRAGVQRRLRLLQVDHVSGEVLSVDAGQDVEVAADELARIVNGEQSVSQARSTVGTAVSSGHLHLIAIDGEIIPHELAAGSTAHAQRSPSWLRKVSRSIKVTRALARSEIRSTLSTWQTVRLIRRIGSDPR